MNDALFLHPTPEDLAAAVAQRWAQLAEAAIRAHGRFTVALSGGRTPRRLYELLASPACASACPGTRPSCILAMSAACRPITLTATHA